MSRFRKVYRELSAEQKEHIEQIKDAAERLALLIEPTRDDMHFEVYMRSSAALERLEEAVMWAVKAYT